MRPSDGVDEEIDLSLYRQAVAAAATKTRTKGFVPVGDSRHNTWRQISREPGPTRPDPSLWNRTIISYLMSQISKLGKNDGFRKILLDPSGTRTKSPKLDAPFVSEKPVKSSLERDFGSNMKFGYEDYASVGDTGASGRSSRCFSVWLGFRMSLVLALHIVIRSAAFADLTLFNA